MTRFTNRVFRTSLSIASAVLFISCGGGGGGGGGDRCIRCSCDAAICDFTAQETDSGRTCEQICSGVNSTCGTVFGIEPGSSQVCQ